MSKIPRIGAIRQLEISTLWVTQTVGTSSSLTFQSKILETLVADARMVEPLCLTYGATLVSTQILTR
jgi:hypothetical protein